MNYIESFNLLGVEAQQIPCIKGKGIPNTSTEGAVGCLYMDTTTSKIYKCIYADGLYDWTELIDDFNNVKIYYSEEISISEPYKVVGIEISDDTFHDVKAGDICVNRQEQRIYQCVDVNIGDATPTVIYWVGLHYMADQIYNPESLNAQSGIAIANAINTKQNKLSLVVENAPQKILYVDGNSSSGSYNCTIISANHEYLVPYTVVSISEEEENIFTIVTRSPSNQMGGITIQCEDKSILELPVDSQFTIFFPLDETREGPVYSEENVIIRLYAENNNEETGSLIKGVKTPEEPTDAANKAYVDTKQEKITDLYYYENIDGEYVEKPVTDFSQFGSRLKLTSLPGGSTRIEELTAKNFEVDNLVVTKTLNMVDSGRITSLPDPVNDNDAVNKAYVDEKIANLGSNGGTIDSEIFNTKMDKFGTVSDGEIEFLKWENKDAANAEVTLFDPSVVLVKNEKVVLEDFIGTEFKVVDKNDGSTLVEQTITADSITEDADDNGSVRFVMLMDLVDDSEVVYLVITEQDIQAEGQIVLKAGISVQTFPDKDVIVTLTKVGTVVKVDNNTILESDSSLYIKTGEKAYYNDNEIATISDLSNKMDKFGKVSIKKNIDLIWDFNIEGLETHPLFEDMYLVLNEEIPLEDCIGGTLKIESAIDVGTVFEHTITEENILVSDATGLDSPCIIILNGGDTSAFMFILPVDCHVEGITVKAGIYLQASPEAITNPGLAYYTFKTNGGNVVNVSGENKFTLKNDDSIALEIDGGANITLSKEDGKAYYNGSEIVSVDEKGYVAESNMNKKFIFNNAIDYLTYDVIEERNEEDNSLLDKHITIKNYNGTAQNIVIPSTIDGYPVTSISDNVFISCENLKNIIIPNSVTGIGNYAFKWCSSLTSITIPNGVTSIGRSVFSDCTALTNITIPNSVTSIGDYAFSNCSSLTSITIPDSVTSIGYYAFSHCTSLQSLIIPEGITDIYNIVQECTSLKTLTIPSSVTSLIRHSTILNCTSLTDIYYGGSEEQWNSIIEHSSVVPSTVTVHYNYKQTIKGLNEEIENLKESGSEGTNITVDQTYIPTSTNAASGKALAEALAGIQTGEGGTIIVDQGYNPESENAQSGKAISGVLQNVFVVGKNKFDKNAITDGKALNDDGSLYTDTNAITSDFIAVEPSTNYVLNSPVYVFGYNSNKEFVKKLASNNYQFTTTDNCAFIRFTGYKFAIDVDTLQLELGSVSTNYEPYNAYTINADNLPTNSITAKKLNTPYVIVDANGGGHFTTITDAVNSVSNNYDSSITILVMPGEYDEAVKCGYRTVHLIGIDKCSCVLYNTLGDYYNCPLYITSGCVKNMTIISRRDDTKDYTGLTGGYAIHIDDYCTNKKLTIDNCTIHSDFNNTLGCGAREGSTLEVSNCFITGASDGFNIHTGGSMSIILRNNLFKSNGTDINFNGTSSSNKINITALFNVTKLVNISDPNVYILDESCFGNKDSKLNYTTV